MRRGDVLDLRIYRPSAPSGPADLLVNHSRLPIGRAETPPVDRTVSERSEPPTLSEDESHITVTGGDFRIAFSNQTGPIDDATPRRKTLIESGPFPAALP